ncbi:protein kinase [Subtercola sp. PAMC28395]|uniref:serine/threonine-protein kinase n=1 Tax=Subtercola sp. PAMC28395 TaxID=2846775 RepID=UPI001C0D898E|nr:serine/threonine-protein kinase [Subtercola sp. PAMC28395]QWT24551.1 protein kinase [Subtercola sp. PAMC28395]
MSARRAPSIPPDLAGFTYVKNLGSGGFADVFLYQEPLKRPVAVKVLLTDKLRSGAVEEFTAEANLMAMLSTHPSIVTIYQAGVSTDGRPYLVMEYCSRPNLHVRFTRERFSVSEAIRIGIQVAGAVETSHRAGILHRDIKPANILVTEYNRPALTDFGISATTTDGSATSTGMSIPWSPPESFAVPAWSGPQSDVYALSATIYTLLAGRSPFELPGATNTSATVINRIENMALPPLGREDVPVSLDEVLARSMSKNPADRPPTAIEFAHLLQRVQIELGMSMTQVEVSEEVIDLIDDRDEDAGLTRVRNIANIDPESTPPVRPRRSGADDPSGSRSGFGAGLDARTGDRSAPPITSVPGLDATVAKGAPRNQPLEWVRPPAVEAPELGETQRRPKNAPAGDVQRGGAAASATPLRRWLLPTIVAGSLVVLGASIVTAVLVTGNPATTPPQVPTTSDTPVDPLVDSAVPTPGSLSGAVGPGGVVFTWVNPLPQAGDLYLWDVVTAGQPGPVATVDSPTVTVPADASGSTCIEVSIRRQNGQASATPAAGCAP